MNKAISGGDDIKKDQRRFLSLVQGNGSFQSRALKVGIIAGDSPCTLKDRPDAGLFQRQAAQPGNGLSAL
ncbi:hypothetical protein [Erwinia persicina]|uniref:hypothetical protein n=1 Tax=Erwinia persicina TaxID=55211 RepID=UPI001781E279|nr:hypothetical protein [Erwinia persicina]MBD8213240.1 hypothetical protein [Erwinia persicina]